MTESAASQIRVEVIVAHPDRYWSVPLLLPEGSTAGDALEQARLEALDGSIRVDPECLAIFGRAVKLQALLRDGDRLEALRPLLVDPMDRRRARARAPAPKR